MKFRAWLRSRVGRAEIPALLLLVVAAAWGLVRTAHVLYLHSPLGSAHQLHDLSTHDLYCYYSIWYVLGHRDCADIALRESYHLPHTWVFFTPIFILGWPMARILFFLLNIAAVVYSWWRVSQLTALQGVRRWLLLAFFVGWTGTSNIIGLGNLTLICLAAVLAAYPFTSRSNGLFLMFSAMKPSLVFPLYFHLLLKRSRALILPFAVFAVCGLAALWWARMGFVEGLKLPAYWSESVGKWTAIDHTCLRRLFAPFITDKLVLTVVMWGTWFALYGIVARWIKDPLSQLAALLLLSLLPMYHYFYDMVLALPALAVFMKRCRLVWPTLMSFCLSWGMFWRLGLLMPAGPLRTLCEAINEVYYPILILIILGGLVWLDRRRGPVPQDAEGQLDSVGATDSQVVNAA
jgi:hypothetical protein